MKNTKVVNIYPSMPIIGTNPPIRSTVKRVTKSLDEIRTCLMARAIVEEILEDGSCIRLNIGNYDKFNIPAHEAGCSCGCGWKIVDKSDNTAEAVEEDNRTPWQVAYDNALAGKNLALMSRKQRRSAEAAARAAADAAVAGTIPSTEELLSEFEESTEEVTTEEVVVENEPVEEVVNEEVIVTETEEVEVVETADIEVLPEEKNE